MFQRINLELNVCVLKLWLYLKYKSSSKKSSGGNTSGCMANFSFIEVTRAVGEVGTELSQVTGTQSDWLSLFKEENVSVCVYVGIRGEM